MSKRMVDLKVEDGKIASINGYEAGGGTAVEANPQEEATQQLEKIKIDNIAYNIAGGSGGGNIVVQTSNSGVISEGRITNKQWLAGGKLLPNTAYEVGDNVRLYYTKEFNTMQLQPNQIISIMHCYPTLRYNSKLQYGNVVLVPTNTDIRPSCNVSGDNVFNLSAGCYITFTVVRGGTTGADVTTPSDDEFDDGAEYTIHTLTVA